MGLDLNQYGTSHIQIVTETNYGVFILELGSYFSFLQIYYKKFTSSRPSSLLLFSFAFSAFCF